MDALGLSRLCPNRCLLFSLSIGRRLVARFSTARGIARHGGIVGGGTLINSFYDLERDLVQRPWRTLFERPVAKKYGLRIAAWLYGIGLVTAWIGLPFPADAGFGLYALLVWLYSHKQWGQHRLGPLIATLLAYTPLLLFGLYVCA